MTENGLSKLLALLSDDSERAAELYLNLQGKLIRYFGWNQCPTPEELADQVLDRVARRVSEGVQIDNPIAYVLGVARRVLLESKPRVVLLPLEGDFAAGTETQEAADLDCLDHCLGEFAPESRSILLEYYSANDRERIRVRQSMADRMGLSVNALRNRCLRLRRQLEECLTRCRRAIGRNAEVE